jgi:S1-C subfamily serine protease
MLYDMGDGVREDDAEAARWYRRAAEQGLAVAQFDLGVMYSLGEGMRRNDTEAVRWYRLAAEQDDAAAQYNLGYMYFSGRGVSENATEARRWYQFAADQGFALAQQMLGYLYANGLGVPENDVQAYMWYSLSAAQGNKDASANMDFLRSRMARSEIVEAQSLAAAWRTSDPELNKTEEAPSEAMEPTAATGTGFYVTTAGHLVTNAHVVEGCELIALTNGSRLSIIAFDESSDLALLRHDEDFTSTPLTLRQGRGVRLAESVLVAGYPLAGLLSSGLNVTTGSVSALAGLGDDRRRIQITAPVQPGTSGGPVLDQSGNVVGVVVSKLDAVAVASVFGDIPQNVNFAVSLGILQALLDENGVEYQTRPSSVPSSNADVAELAKAATVQVLCNG